MPAIQFDARNIPVAGDFQPWGEGKHKVIIVESSLNTSGDKPIIEFGFKNIGPLDVHNSSDTGRIHNERVNFTHEVGMRILSSICHAVGILQPQTTEQLHGRAFVINMVRDPKPSVDKQKQPVIDPATGQQKIVIFNKVTAYYNADGSTLTGSGSTVTSTASAPAAGPATAPAWAATTTPPPQPVAPQPAPVAHPQPVAPVLYYVSHKGQNITPAPIPAAAVAALGLPPAEILVCENGGTEWKPGTILGVTPTPPPPVAAAVPNAVPPWAQTPKQ